MVLIFECLVVEGSFLTSPEIVSDSRLRGRIDSLKKSALNASSLSATRAHAAYAALGSRVNSAAFAQRRGAIRGTRATQGRERVRFLRQIPAIRT